MGKCQRGQRCTFAHTEDELTVAPDVTKTSICRAWKAGQCDKISRLCPFAHGAAELKTTPLFKEYCKAEIMIDYNGQDRGARTKGKGKKAALMKAAQQEVAALKHDSNTGRKGKTKANGKD